MANTKAQKKEILHEKQIRFCNEYLIDFNGTQAAIRAGYAEKTAEQQACRLLRNVKVANFLDERKEEISKSSKVSIDKVVNELGYIAFSNITDYIEVKEDSITLTNWTKLSKEQTAAIESVHQTKDGYRIKLYNKPQALEMIGKHLGMYVEAKPDIPFSEEFSLENGWTDEKLMEYVNGS